MPALPGACRCGEALRVQHRLEAERVGGCEPWAVRNHACVAVGAGMLAPALATMLSVVMTDAVLPGDAQEIFARVADRTFNRIDSDGCTSTNDTVLLMGSGASGVELTEAELESARIPQAVLVDRSQALDPG